MINNCTAICTNILERFKHKFVSNFSGCPLPPWGKSWLMPMDGDLWGGPEGGGSARHLTIIKEAEIWQEIGKGTSVGRKKRAEPFCPSTVWNENVARICPLLWNPNKNLTISPSEGQIPLRKAYEIELRQSHSLYEIHTASRLPLVHQMLCSVCIWKM